MPRRPRLDPSVFNLPVGKMREGYYTDKYFVRAQEVLRADDHHPRVLMQVFGKSDAYLGGIDEAIAILKLCATPWDDLVVHALYDGDKIETWETVLTIEGPYDAFAHLETLYLGVLARRTRVGTNTRHVVDAARPKDVMFFPARHDHWLVQTGDGYAAHIAGAIGVSTDAQASWWGSEGVGTVPHAMIAAYGGDTVLASQKFAEYMPEDVRLISLVDFDNDCVTTSSRPRACSASVCTAYGSIRRRRSWTAPSFRKWDGSSRRASPRSSSGTCGAPSIAKGFSTSESWYRAASPSRRSGISNGRGFRWMRMGWARRCTAGGSISRPTW